MDTTTQTLPVARGPHRLYAEAVPGIGAPIVLMHGFPDNTHLYDRLVPHLAGRRPVVRFDFLGWGRSDKPTGYPYTAANQVGDLAVVTEAVREQPASSGVERLRQLPQFCRSSAWPGGLGRANLMLLRLNSVRPNRTFQPVPPGEAGVPLRLCRRHSHQRRSKRGSGGSASQSGSGLV
jgi:hypothetical protein